MPPLKLPAFAAVPAKPPRVQHQNLEQRVKALEEYTDRLNSWAIGTVISLTAWSKQLNDLFNIGSVKRL